MLVHIHFIKRVSLSQGYISSKRFNNDFNTVDIDIRGCIRNLVLQVPLLNTGSVLERVPLNVSQNFAGSAEPLEPILTWPLDIA